MKIYHYLAQKHMYSHVCIQGTPQNVIRKYWKHDLKNALHLYRVYFKNPLSWVSFAVSSNLVCIVILFKIVTLIFPHRLHVCNAIYVEYRVVYIYRAVVSYILHVLWKRGMKPYMQTWLYILVDGRYVTKYQPMQSLHCTSPLLFLSHVLYLLWCAVYIGILLFNEHDEHMNPYRDS